MCVLDLNRTLTKQARSVRPGACQLQDTAPSKAVANGKDLVVLDNIEVARLHSTPQLQQLRFTVRNTEYPVIKRSTYCAEGC